MLSSFCSSGLHVYYIQSILFGVALCQPIDSTNFPGLSTPRSYFPHFILLTSQQNLRHMITPSSLKQFHHLTSRWPHAPGFPHLPWLLLLILLCWLLLSFWPLDIGGLPVSVLRLFLSVHSFSNLIHSGAITITAPQIAPHFFLSPDCITELQTLHLTSLLRCLIRYIKRKIQTNLSFPPLP